jgi:phospholipid transport system substrate-binding protein
MLFIGTVMKIATSMVFNRTLTQLLAQASLIVGLTMAATVPVFAQTAQGSPEAFVKATAEDLLATLKNDKAVLAGDPQRINALVSEKILPNVNLAKMTQSAMGRNWSKASPEQQAALQKEFRVLLQRTYGGALSLAKDATLEMRRSRNEPDATDVVVRTNVVVPKGEPISVDYRLEKIAGSWKVYDLNVAGSWLVQNYRGVFAKEVEANGIDGLIQFLKKRNGSK